MIRYLIIITFAVLLSTPAVADMTGAGDAAQTLQLTKIYAVLQSKYAVVIKKLQEARAQSALLQGLVDKARVMKREYDFVKNFRVENVIAQVRGDLEGLTYIDDLNGKSAEAQFDLMMADIDRRFDRPNGKDQKMRRKLKSRIKELQRLQELLKAKLEEATSIVKSGSNYRSIAAANATTNCMLLSLEAQRQQRAIMDEVQDVAEKIEMEDKVDDFSRALKKIGKGSASVE